MGATAGVGDAAMKVDCILTLCSRRHWDFALLTDLSFDCSGVREYTHEGWMWTLITRGKVGILLSGRLTKKWREGGARAVVRGGQERKGIRCMGLVFPRKGRRRGMSLLCACAPVSGAEFAKERERFHDEVRFVESRCRGADN
eukprot:6427907-Pyramimonas_sp.AAC.1